MFTRCIRLILITLAVLSLSTACGQDSGSNSPWQEEFAISDCNLLTEGRNTYFILEPGFRLVLEGEDERLHVTVLAETKTVDGVVTRVVEEREWADGELYEVSRNYFAICEETKDVFYFGEDVDFYESGTLVKHEGAWLAGRDGNRAGMIMPGTPKQKMMYYQEIAPDVAMDRAEIVSLNETCETPAGTFSNCMKVKEGTALNILETEYKYYAPGIGLIRDADLLLKRYGFIKD